MADKRVKIRLYVDASLRVAQSVLLNRDQAHYLFAAPVGPEGGFAEAKQGDWR